MQGQVAGAVSAHALGGVKAGGQVLSQVAQHHLDLEAATAEEDGLNAGADPWRRDATRLEHGAAPHAHLAVEQRWVVEDQPPLAAGRAVALDQLDVLLLQQSLRQLKGVGDSRGGTDEGRSRSVKGTYPFQPPDDIGDLAAKEPAVHVQLVDDDEVEAREEPAPASVMGE